jgi:hypothetical protein
VVGDALEDYNGILEKARTLADIITEAAQAEFDTKSEKWARTNETPFWHPHRRTGGAQSGNRIGFETEICRAIMALQRELSCCLYGNRGIIPGGRAVRGSG